MPPNRVSKATAKDKVKGRKKRSQEEEEGAQDIPQAPGPLDEPPEEAPEEGEDQPDPSDADGSSDEEEEEESAKAKVPQLSAEVEQELAELYQENPIFYDKSRSDFKNKKKRDRLLEEKGAKLNLTASDIKLWYRSQRTILGKVEKKYSGQARRRLTARQKWVENNLGFLKRHIVHRPMGSQLGQVPDADDDSEPSSSVTQQPSKKRPKKQDVDAALLEFLQKSDKQTGDLRTKVDAAMSQTSDEKASFVDWMLQALRPLPRHLWREFTKEAFSLVNKYQERVESEQAQQQYQQLQQPQQLRPPTPQMPIPARPSSLPAHWPQQDMSQMPTQMYAPMYPWAAPGQASTSQAPANTSQGSAGSFNLLNLLPSTPGTQQQQQSGSQPSDIVAAAARVLIDDH